MKWKKENINEINIVTVIRKPVLLMCMIMKAIMWEEAYNIND